MEAKTKKENPCEDKMTYEDPDKKDNAKVDKMIYEDPHKIYKGKQRTRFVFHIVAYIRTLTLVLTRTLILTLLP